MSNATGKESKLRFQLTDRISSVNIIDNFYRSQFNGVIWMKTCLQRAQGRHISDKPIGINQYLKEFYVKGVVGRNDPQNI